MKNNEVNPTFSIIIPVFNGADFITATLDAVAAQTFTDFEIVITNDGSNDDTEMIIMQYIAAFPSLTVNFSSQINKAIAGNIMYEPRNLVGMRFDDNLVGHSRVNYRCHRTVIINDEFIGIGPHIIHP